MERDGNKSRKGGFSALISIEGQVYKGEDQKEDREEIGMRGKKGRLQSKEMKRHWNNSHSSGLKIRRDWGYEGRCGGEIRWQGGFGNYVFLLGVWRRYR
jgi:hypothetical protein